jgi:hypothetical protein
VTVGRVGAVRAYDESDAASDDSDVRQEALPPSDLHWRRPHVLWLRTGRPPIDRVAMRVTDATEIRRAHATRSKNIAQREANGLVSRFDLTQENVTKVTRGSHASARARAWFGSL